ncbi:unnamed protein product [Cercospora beticola]|nr:unnamed protein product [Cercospora beticola]
MKAAALYTAIVMALTAWAAPTPQDLNCPSHCHPGTLEDGTPWCIHNVSPSMSCYG